MLVLPQKVTISLSAHNIKHFEELGYDIPKYKDNHYRMSIKRGTMLEVDVEDLQFGSHTMVDVICDYCGRVFKQEYRKYFRTKTELNTKDVCENCIAKKRKETMLLKYNVENSMKLEEFLNKAKTTNIEKYGVESIFQSEIYKNKTKETNLLKYGVSNPMQNEKVKEKMRLNNLLKRGFEQVFQDPIVRQKCADSYYRNGTCKTSSQQLIIYNLLKEKKYNVELNFPVSKVNIDIKLLISNINIAIEYDGWYWHQDTYKDRKRDEFLKTQGWKILRIRSSTQIPSLEQIEESIKKLVDTDITFTQIILDDWQDKIKII